MTVDIESDGESRSAFDAEISSAARLLYESDPSLLEPAQGFETRYSPDTFADHLSSMVALIDEKNNTKLPHGPMSEWMGLGPTVVRSILLRHPLVARVQTVRALLELASNRSGAPALLVIKAFAGSYNTTKTQRGVHAFQSGRKRQVHLDLLAVTTSGRVILVGSELFSVEDVTADLARQHALAMLGAEDLGRLSKRDRLAKYPEYVAQYHREHWGVHRTGRAPLGIAEHVDALLAEAFRAAQICDAPSLLDGIPIVGGQLTASTSLGLLPEFPSCYLVGHDAPSIERLLERGLIPVLDLNTAANTIPGVASVLPYRVRVRADDGRMTPLDGDALIEMAADPIRAVPVPRHELDLHGTGSLRLSITYLDGEIDLPNGGSQPVRVYYRVGYRTPENLYLVAAPAATPPDYDQALHALISDSTYLHEHGVGPIERARSACVKKGAFDPGGERAAPTESLAAIGRLAADRELHRDFARSSRND